MANYEPDKITFSRRSQLGILFMSGCCSAVGMFLYFWGGG